MDAFTDESSLRIAGLDEAGRGPLAGPVVAAAVILDPGRSLDGLADSKALSPRRRIQLAEFIKRQALCWAVGIASVGEIDSINILQATLLAMQRAVTGLSLSPTQLLVDGNQLPRSLACPARAIVKGDQTVDCISAASIIAKTYRDELMFELDSLYPHYGFKDHKGYGTRRHMEALERFGVSPVHRRSFAPIRHRLKISP